MKAAVCNAADCGARMMWVKTINGGVAPLDADSIKPEYAKPNDVILVKREKADEPLALSCTAIREEHVEKMARQGVAFYRDHHATCTNPEDFRSTPL